MDSEKKNRKTEGSQYGRRQKEKGKGGKEEGRVGKIIENLTGHLLFHKTYTYAWVY